MMLNNEVRVLVGVCVLFWTALLVVPLTGAVPIYEPVTSPAIITINCSDCDAMELRSASEHLWHTIEGNGSVFEVPSQDSRLQGAYHFRLYDGVKQLPQEGFFTTTRSTGHPLLYNVSAGLFSRGGEANYYCNPYKDSGFTCDMDHLQARQSLRFMYAYQMTGNETYRDFMYEYIFSDYGSSATCNHMEGDFNCTQSSEIYSVSSTGAHKQGALIHAYWTLYRMTGNESIRVIAGNYSRGSAEECDVWTGDFDCGDAQSQGHMMRGYWTAYEVSGNETYKRIARNLTQVSQQQGYAHPTVLAGLAKAQALTVDYASRIESLAANLSDKCVQENCDARAKSETVSAFLEAYRTTGTHTYLEHAKGNLLAALPDGSACHPLEGNYSCFTSEEQSALAYAFTQSYYAVMGADAFYNVHITESADVGENLTVRIGWNGIIQNRTAHYGFAGSWTTRNLSGSSFVVPAEELKAEAPLQVYLTGDGIRYPENGTINFFVNTHNPDLYQELDRLSRNDPREYCDPYGTDLRLEDYNCKFEHFQGSLTQGLLEGSRLTGNSTYELKARTLGNSQIDPDDIFDTCDHYDDDFDCEDQRDGVELPIDTTGARRQGGIIDSYLSLYRQTRNASYRRKAVSYLLGHAKECDVWEGEFRCPDNVSQAYMLQAYSKAYDVTGKPALRDIAERLAGQALAFNTSGNLSVTLLDSLWEYNRFADNRTIQAVLQEGMQNFSKRCVEEACAVKPFARNIHLYWKAYRISLNPDYKQSALQKYQKGPSPEAEYDEEGRYWDCALRGEDIDYQCRTPLKQGEMEKALALQLGTYIKSNYTLNLTLHHPPRVALDTEFNMTVALNNTNDVALTDIIVSFTPSELDVTGVRPYNETVFEVSTDNLSVTYDSVPANSVINTTWSVNATRGGERRLESVVSRDSIWSTESTVIIDRIGKTDFMEKPLPIWMPRNTGGNASYQVLNPYRFFLSNVTVRFNTTGARIEETDHFNLTNISARVDEVNESSLWVREDSLSPVYMSGGNNFTLNISYYTGAAGAKTVDMLINTTYGAYQQSNLSFFIYDELIAHESAMPSAWTLKNPFTLRFNLSNAESYSLKNLSLVLNISQGFSVNDVDYRFANVTNVSVAPGLKVLNLSVLKMNDTTQQYIEWELVPLATGEYSPGVVAKNEYVTKGFGAGDLQILSHNVFVVEDHFSTVETDGVAHNQSFWMTVKNNISSPINDVSIVLRPTSGVNVTTLSLNYTEHNETSIQPTNISPTHNLSLIQDRDNESVHADAWNVSFNMSTQGPYDGFHVFTIDHFLRNATPQNISCLLYSDSNKTREEELEGTIGGNLTRYSHNLSRNRSLTVNLTLPSYTTMHNLTLVWETNFSVADESLNDSGIGNATFYEDNRTLCKYSYMDDVERGIDRLHCPLNRTQNITERSINLNLTVHNGSAIRNATYNFSMRFFGIANYSIYNTTVRNGSIEANASRLRCTFNVSSSSPGQMQLRATAQQNMSLDRIQATLNYSYTHVGEGEVSGNTVTFANMSAGESRRVVGSYDIITSESTERMSVNITSAEGAQHTMDRVLRSYTPPSDGDSGTGGTGGGGGSAPPAPENETNTSESRFIIYDYSNYSLQTLLPAYPELSSPFNLSDTETFTDLCNYSNATIGCFEVRRSITADSMSLTVMYDCNGTGVPTYIYDPNASAQGARLSSMACQNCTYRNLSEGYLFNIFNLSSTLRLEYNLSDTDNPRFVRPLIMQHSPAFYEPAPSNVTEKNETTPTNETKVFDKVTVSSNEIFKSVVNWVGSVVSHLPIFVMIAVALGGYASYHVYRSGIIGNTFEYITRRIGKLFRWGVRGIGFIVRWIGDIYYYLFYCCEKFFSDSMAARVYHRIRHALTSGEGRIQRDYDERFYLLLDITRQLSEGTSPTTVLRKLGRIKVDGELAPQLRWMKELIRRQAQSSYYEQRAQELYSRQTTGQGQSIPDMEKIWRGNKDLSEPQSFVGSPAIPKGVSSQHSSSVVEDIFFKLQNVLYDIEQGDYESAQDQFENVNELMRTKEEDLRKMTTESYYMLDTLYEDARMKLQDSAANTGGGEDNSAGGEE